MRNILLISIIFLFSCSEEKTTIINCEKWELNKSIFYNVEYTEIKTNNDSVITAKKSIYKVELIVNEIGDSNQITWSIKREIRKPDSLLTDAEKLLSDTIAYEEEYKIIYQTNGFGQYQQITNWSELERSITNSWNDYKDTLNINSASKEEAIKNIESVFMNRATLEAKLTIAILPLHCIYGLPVSNKPIKATEVMTGLNNQPLSSKMTQKVLAEENDFLLMQITHEFDSNQVLSQVNDIVQELGNKEMSSHIKMTDTCNVGYNKLTSWPYQVEFWRTAKLGNIQKNITVSLTKIEH